MASKKNKESKTYLLRLSKDERKLFDAAAKKEELVLAAWMRQVLIKTAKKILKNDE